MGILIYLVDDVNGEWQYRLIKYAIVNIKNINPGNIIPLILIWCV